MLKKFIFGQERMQVSKGIITSAIIGGILGALVGFVYKTGTLTIPVILHIFKASPIDASITGTVLGILVGAVTNSLIIIFIQPSKDPKYKSYEKDSKFQLLEEQLDISKKRVQTGEVTVHKEVLREQKNVIVPVTREELVVEKKVIDEEASNKAVERVETIRIPISEERIEVIKHPVVLEDVKVYKRQFQDIKHVEENLKKEKIYMETTGDIEVLNKKKNLN